LARRQVAQVRHGKLKTVAVQVLIHDVSSASGSHRRRP
jgi:hypothetical protein